MMASLDVHKLRTRLEARFGLELTVNIEEIDGGGFPVVRPVDLPRPNGFGVAIAKTPKQIEASLRIDAFTKSLLRQMSEADEFSRSLFLTLVEEAQSRGIRVLVSINGNSISSAANLPSGEWCKLELDCDARLALGSSDDSVLETALAVTSRCFGLVLSLLPVEAVADSIPGFEPRLPEGAKFRVEVNRYERSPVNRAACISHYGTKCQVCDFDFVSKYGLLGEDYIEVHHRTPVSAMGGAYLINPIKDLIPVCANCHAMLHREDPPLTVEALKALLKC